MAFDEKSVTNRNKIYEVPAGTVILNQGEINLDMYKILSGHVEMYTDYGTDNEVMIGVLGPGACFGEFGLLTGQPAIYTIIAYSTLKILRVTEELMSDFMLNNQDSVLQIMKNMANNMLKMQHQISQLNKELADKEVEISVNVNVVKENMRNYAVYGYNKYRKKKDDPNEGGMRYIRKN